MKRNFFFTTLLSIAMLFVACDNSSNDVDKIVDPTIKVEAGQATADSITFTISSTDAESVAYVVVDASRGVPSNDAILKGTTVEANKAVVITVDNLSPESDYLVVAAAEAHDKVVASSGKMTTRKADEPVAELAVELKAVEEGENFIMFEITTVNAEKAAYIVYRDDQYDNLDESEFVELGSPVEVNSTSCIYSMPCPPTIATCLYSGSKKIGCPLIA